MAKYAVATRSIYGPGNRAKAEASADRVYALYRSQPGFEHAHFIGFDEATGEYGSLTVFDNKEHAEAAFNATKQQREQVSRDLGIQRLGTSDFRIVELYEPKG
jgi:heme-degrading monooxygenase HmoA